MQKLKNVNIHFLILLNIAICACFNDILIFFLKMNYGTCLAISSLFVIITNVFIIKKKYIKISSDFELWDLAFIVTMIIATIIRIAIPDFSYDVKNYHIYLQENVFTDKINFDFFAGSIVNTFLFPLGDRMNYIFRYILGYRLGTILSYYSIIVLFYQTKNILNILCGKSKINSILSSLCFTSYIIKIWTGTYYIDIYSTVFILEIIYFILKEKDCYLSKKKIYIISLLTGIATAIKLPNFIIIFPIIALSILAKRKQIKVRNVGYYIIATIVFVTPFLIYLIENIKQTGNPIFPYYNNVFRSNFFGNFAWKDARFGLPNWKYIFIWPIWTSIFGLGYGDDCIITDAIWAIGYTVTTLYVIYSTIIKRNRNIKLYKFSILTLILTFVWIIFLEGYMRYALVIPVMYCIIISALISDSIKSVKTHLTAGLSTKIVKLFLITISVFLVVQNLSGFLYAYEYEGLFKNYQLVFKDRENTKIQIDGVWGVIDDDSALTQLLREKNVPIYNLEKSMFSSSKLAIEKYNENISNKKIYILCLEEDADYKLGKIKENNFNAIKIREYTSEQVAYIKKGSKLFLYKLEKMNGGQN